ncbi:MAG: hypothetical protein GWM98_24280 [Nitrospinaceae bacterium]|nr:hypothetical protein [Nitrospinaceae bacterium]NIR57008.1 hypothetical protein [Nitrospinaceae bacterium]NIS87465.1 hypothetical protein [Nitrospinaceae bacterium]NIT84314.1 hypothetical protein [Nitrospinaceae bacterium]NIU46504.1 hypothetical protein [Nitrospinaceae bacterium]
MLGADYTFRVGDGLHVLVEYFLSVRENKSTLLDPEGNRLFHQIGFLLDQPVGLDIRWQVFSLFDFRDGSFQVVPQVEYFLFRQTYLYLTGRWGGRVETGKKNGRLFRKTPVFNGTESNIGLTLVVYF